MAARRGSMTKIFILNWLAKNILKNTRVFLLFLWLSYYTIVGTYTAV